VQQADFPIISTALESGWPLDQPVSSGWREAWLPSGDQPGDSSFQRLQGVGLSHGTQSVRQRSVRGNRTAMPLFLYGVGCGQ
jgi:hypothetical protein